jgi:signal recognition particle subunit SRP54
MFESLANKFQDSLQKLRGEKQISESNIKTALADLRRALLEADVSLKATKLFIETVETKALGAEVLRGVKPYEQFIKIVQDSLTGLLSTSAPKPKYQQILLLGLQGAGKTSTAAKLAFKFREQKPLLIPCDLQRPAAVDQLRILAKQAEVAFLEPSAAGIDLSGIANAHQTNKSAYLYKLVDYALSLKGHNCLIFDTAGRQQLYAELMQELQELESYIKKQSSHELSKILVLDSLIGQEAASIASSFNDKVSIDGVILTKLDSDTRGGAALSVVTALAKPILMSAVGEKLSDLEEFHPERIASRILGMGDIVSLVEKAQAGIEEEEARKLEAELMRGNFNYETFVAAQNMMSKLGNMKQMLDMLGMGSMLKQFGISSDKQESLMQESQNKIKNYKTAISSMTTDERRKPELLSRHPSARNRKARIARGSGLKETDIEKLCAEFNKMRELFGNLGPMMQMMKGSNPMAKLNPLANMASMRGMPQLASPRAGNPGPKKGEKPKIKGFKN